MRSICCILGAGYSHVAGVPLTKDLFATRSLRIPSQVAARRFQAVWDDYEAWSLENPCGNAEGYLASLPKRGQSNGWVANETHVLRRNSGTTSRTGFTLSFSGLPVPTRAIPPFEWAVELLAAVLASPLATDTTVTNFRYGARVMFPFRCPPHLLFWQEVLAKSNNVSAITTNYDILIERQLRHRPMTRVFGPGCYYGGIPKPQLLRGTQLPWAYQGNYIELQGVVPVYKLHGSLSWSFGSVGLELFQDLRPAFRAGGDSAIIPPIPEKEIPTWLKPVWKSAEEDLARAAVWIVCGYSLPSYDAAITKLLRRAALAGNLESILILDPCAADISCRYSAIAENARVMPMEGLPEGIDTLRKLL